MENIEDNLLKYRVRKRRQERFERFREKAWSFLMLGVRGGSNPEDDNAPRTDITLNVNEVAPSSELSQSDYDVDSVCSSEEDVIVESTSSSDMVLKYTLWVVYLALWITVYIIAIELQFGIVYLMLSGLVAIYFNTRTGPKKANEVSAYSVFNKDCQSIDGTLKAEQFEREMGIR